MCFLRRGVVSTSPNPQAGGPPLVSCPRLLIQFIHSYPPYRRPFLHPQPEDAPCRGDMDPHPPYSPNLASCDFFLFPKLKLQMKGRRFATIEEIQEESQWVLDTVPKTDFQGCFQAWQKRWDHCIRAKGSNLKVMEEFNIQGKQTSFYKYCPGTCGYILVLSESAMLQLLSTTDHIKNNMRRVWKVKIHYV